MLASTLCSVRTVRADGPVYDEMPVNPANVRGWTKAKNFPGDVRLMLHGDAGFEQTTFDGYFNNVLFPQFTLYKEPGNVMVTASDPKNKTVTWRQSGLPFCREDFLKTFVLQANSNPDAGPFNHLNELTVQAMRTIALGNYHPLARYNAAILLGSLVQYRQQESPYPGALPALMACLDANSDLVRVAALQGILKQVKAKTDGQNRPQVMAAMLKIVGEKTPPQGRTADGHDWIAPASNRRACRDGRSGPESVGRRCPQCGLARRSILNRLGLYRSKSARQHRIPCARRHERHGDGRENRSGGARRLQIGSRSRDAAA